MLQAASVCMLRHMWVSNKTRLKKGTGGHSAERICIMLDMFQIISAHRQKGIAVHNIRLCSASKDFPTTHVIPRLYQAAIRKSSLHAMIGPTALFTVASR